MSTFSWIIAAAIANAILSDDDDKSKGEKKPMRKYCNCTNSAKRMKSLQKRFEKTKDELQNIENELDIIDADFPVLPKDKWLKRVKESKLTPEEVEALCKAQPPQTKDRARTYIKLNKPICVQGTPTNSQVQGSDNEDTHSEVVTINKETLVSLLKDYPYLSENLKEVAFFDDGKYQKLKSYLKNLFKELQEDQKFQEFVLDNFKGKTLTDKQIQEIRTAYNKLQKLIGDYPLL